MKPTIYVAGASADAARCSFYMRALEHVGFGITHDWTVPVLERWALLGFDADDIGLADDTLTATRAAELASASIDAIRRSQFLWLLAPPPGKKSEGAWFELGLAVRNPKTMTLISGPTHNIFRHAAERYYETHAAALAALTDGLVL